MYRGLLIFILCTLVCPDISLQQDISENPCDGGQTIKATLASTGTITSPNYPEPYPNSVNCVWEIASPENTRIATKFEHLFAIEETGYGSGCYDTITYIDGGNSFLACGTRPVESFVSTLNMLRFEFLSDLDFTFSGFSFNWTVVAAENVNRDTIIIERNNGTISSPNYPSAYDTLADLTWIINATEGERILVEIEEVDIEGSFTCYYDLLKISDEKDSSDILCGKYNSKQVLFHSNIIHVSFVSDISVTGTGFMLNFTTIAEQPLCNATNYTGTSGIISTPYYPLAYPPSFECTWHITTPENTFIAIRFNSLFEIRKSSTTECFVFRDHLKINDGPDQSYPQYQGLHCGTHAPRGFRSSSNMLTIFFTSQFPYPDGSVGFSLNWTAEDACPSDQFNCWDGTCLNETLKCNGVVDCPNDNADETICSKTKSSESCGITEIAPIFKWDYRILGGHEANHGSWPWQGFFEGLASRGWMYICGATLISDEWALTAAHCLRKGPELRVIMGDHDRTQVNTTTQQIATVDSMFAPSEYDHESDQAILNGYDIALLHVSTPFTVTKWVKPICIPESTPDPGEIVIITGWGSTSPSGFGSEVLNQVRARIYSTEQCNKYDITLPDGVFCAGEEIGAASSCSGDSGGPAVYLRNGTWGVAGVVSFASQCGTVGIPSVYTDVSAYSLYVNNLIDNGPTVPVVETRVINDATEGTISSPNYGDASNPKYPMNTHMKWYITAPKDTRITVRFEDAFNIEWAKFVSDRCIFDYLLIYDGSTTMSTKYRNQKMCGPVAPPNFESNTNAIIVEFRSDGSFESIGFSFNWTITDACQPDEYRCWDGQCIPSSKKCDGTKNCTSNEDEFECRLLDESTSVECGKPYVAPKFPWSPLIVGGHHAQDGSWPWMVKLEVQYFGKWVHQCGGSIVAEYLVLTAAHCVDPFVQYQVVVGEHNNRVLSGREIRINVIYTIIHPDNSDVLNDIAILRLESPIDFTTKWIKPVCLPTNVDDNPVEGTLCVVAGWGVDVDAENVDSAVTLQQIPTEILNDATCDEEESKLRGSLEYDYICAGHENLRTSTCIGDSGGPLVCLVEGAWRQYGIVSWAVFCASRTYYERVAKHLDLINQVKSSEFCAKYEVQEALSGKVTIPTIYGEYLSRIDCTWHLRGPDKTILLLQFEKFDVEDCSPGFYFDFLTVYDGNSTSSEKFLDQVFCGNNRTIRPFLSSTNEVLLTFESDSGDQFTGFRLSWTAVEDCKADEFLCWNGTCISSALRCNGIIDCVEGRDEIECPHLSDTCGKQTVAPDLLREIRIVGGGHAPQGAWPWQGYLTDESNSFICGATIVDVKWMMTSAECVYEKSFEFIFAVVGQTELYLSDIETTFGVGEIFFHENYNGFGTDYDIALIKLKREIVYNDFIQPACVVTSNATDSDRLAIGENCVITGWGQTHVSPFERQPSVFLRQTRVPILDQDVCKKISTSPSDFNRNRMFCSGNLQGGGFDGCYHDSGGPLVCFRDNVWRQFGIITHLLGCGTPGTPTYYTKVSYYGEWIEQLIPNIASKTRSSPAATSLTTAAIYSTMSATTGILPTSSNEATGSPVAATRPPVFSATATKPSVFSATATSPLVYSATAPRPSVVSVTSSNAHCNTTRATTIRTTQPVTTTSSTRSVSLEIFFVALAFLVSHCSNSFVYAI